LTGENSVFENIFSNFLSDICEKTEKWLVSSISWKFLRNPNPYDLKKCARERRGGDGFGRVQPAGPWLACFSGRCFPGFSFYPAFLSDTAYCTRALRPGALALRAFSLVLSRCLVSTPGWRVPLLP
jgi:hypothetical protein